MKYHDEEVLPGYDTPEHMNSMGNILGRIMNSYQCVVNMMIRASNERNHARRLAEEWREHCSVLYDVKEEAYGTPDIPDPETTALPWEEEMKP